MPLEWPQVVISFLSGGAFGAIINSVLTHYRNRVQPVGYKIATMKYVGPAPYSAAALPLIQDLDETIIALIPNPWIAIFEVTNKGNKDFEEFSFGHEWRDGETVSHIEASSPDRHHIVTLGPRTDVSSTTTAIDFNLQPFNRGDSYNFRLYLSLPPEKGSAEPPTISCKHPIKFVSALPLTTRASQASFKVIDKISFRILK